MPHTRNRISRDNADSVGFQRTPVYTCSAVCKAKVVVFDSCNARRENMSCVLVADLGFDCFWDWMCGGGTKPLCVCAAHVPSCVCVLRS